MTVDAELLDDAIDDGATARADLRELADLASEVGTALAGWRLSTAERAVLYERALALSRRSRMAVLRRLGWKAPALVGGGLVTAGAVTAIAIAVARGRQQHSQPPLPA
ncbi:MAG: hypothetical protein JOZ92_09815 [Candidatus Dormibacteraeota bacterium]|nr:hypothetical protein [Candidatus Dormibacteraeota bacterium]